MHKWSLLLALIAVLEPIASFTDRSLVNGRGECCELESDSLQDRRVSFSRKAVSFPEIRQVRSEERRDTRRHEVTRNNRLATRERDTHAYIDTRRSADHLSERSITRDINRRDRFRESTRDAVARDSRNFLQRDSDNRRSYRDVRTTNKETLLPMSIQDSRRSSIRDGDDSRLSRRFNVPSRFARDDFRKISENRGSPVAEMTRHNEIRAGRDLHARSMESSVRRNSREENARMLNRQANRRRNTLELRDSQYVERRNSLDVSRRTTVRLSEDRNTAERRIESRDKEAHHSGASREARGETRRDLSETRLSHERRDESRIAERRVESAGRRSDTNRNREVRDSRRFSSPSRNVRSVRSESLPLESSRKAMSVERAASRSRTDVRRGYDGELVRARENTLERRSRTRRTADSRRNRSREISIEPKTMASLALERDAVSARTPPMSKIISTKIDESNFMNWQYFLYTLQAIYTCSILVHVFGYKNTDKKKYGFGSNWLVSKEMVKVD